MGSFTRAGSVNPKPRAAYPPNAKPNQYLPQRAAEKANHENNYRVNLVQGMALLEKTIVNIQYLLAVVVLITHLGCLFSVSQQICHTPTTGG